MAALQLVSVNTGRAAPLPAGDRTVMSGIVKRAVASAQVVALGLDGDEQVDQSVHGGLAKAVYAYPSEHYAFWNTVRRQTLRSDGRARADGLLPYADLPDLPWGAMGENLSLAGLVEAEVYIGDVLRIGSTELVVTSPRIPCFKFAAVMGFAQAPKLMVQSGYCGWYLEVRTPGEIAPGMAIELRPGDREHSLSITTQFKMLTRRMAANG